MPKEKFDFSGYATKNNIKCTDGRVIMRDAFKGNDGKSVPLVFQHIHNSLENVLGHACLENRPDGVYAYGVFNKTDAGKRAKELVKNGDIISLSIYANQLSQNGSNVIHGVIKEVSLVLGGANPGATIDNLSFEHTDGSSDSIEDEVVICYNIPLIHSDLEDDEDIEHGDEGGETVEDVIASMSDKQKNAMYYMLSQAIGDEDSEGDEAEHSDEGGNDMKYNAFDNRDNKEHKEKPNRTLSHDDFAVIIETAKKCGSFHDAVLAHADEFGITNVEVLFPDARTLTSDPEFLTRENAWVSVVLKAIGKFPFSRIKSNIIDMDISTARAKGYIKGSEKKETFLKAAKRVTTPATIYVKQKLDRDDIIDLVDFNAADIVRKELRILFDEELAQAALVGDGRSLDDENKINEENIRPIWTDVPLFSIKEVLTTNADYALMVEEIAASHEHYKGSGSPVLYITPGLHTKMLWIKDLNLRRIYESDASLCAALRVSAIVDVPVFEDKYRTATTELDGEASNGKVKDLLCIKVNLNDYKFGADKGGEATNFEDFDIDFNQMKYLLEGRCSGALTKPKSAQVFEFQRP